MIKTKQELLNHFSDINEMYNNPFMYQTLNNMIDELLEQQPCDDCISREQVLYEAIYYADRPTDTFIKDVLKQLPSVTPQTGWIPCSERLPKSGNDVLATDDVDMFVAWYDSEGWRSTDKNFDYDTPIVAWMPLPQAYKAESEEVE